MYGIKVQTSHCQTGRRGSRHATIRYLFKFQVTAIQFVNPHTSSIPNSSTLVFAADTNFFKVFNFPLIKGDPDRAFRLSNTLVMTRSAAEKYFGDAEAVGKMVRLSGLNGDEQQT